MTVYGLSVQTRVMLRSPRIACGPQVAEEMEPDRFHRLHAAFQAGDFQALRKLAEKLGLKEVAAVLLAAETKTKR